MKKLLKILPVVLMVCFAVNSVFAIPDVGQLSGSTTEMQAEAVASIVQNTSGTLVTILFSLLIVIISIVANWKIFKKAGKPGWACIVPIYASVVQFKIVGLSPWLLLLYFVPVINYAAAVIFAILIAFRMAKSFGKGIGWGLGLLFLSFIFNLVLAFGSSKYVGPNGNTQA